MLILSTPLEWDAIIGREIGHSQSPLELISSIFSQQTSEFLENVSLSFKWEKMCYDMFILLLAFCAAKVELCHHKFLPDFHYFVPLGQVSHKVAMFVCLCVCFSPFQWYLFEASLALRIPPHSPPPQFNQINCLPLFGNKKKYIDLKKWNQRRRKNLKPPLIKKNKNFCYCIGATIRWLWESQCLQ